MNRVLSWTANASRFLCLRLLEVGSHILDAAGSHAPVPNVEPVLRPLNAVLNLHLVNSTRRLRRLHTVNGTTNTYATVLSVVPSSSAEGILGGANISAVYMESLAAAVAIDSVTAGNVAVLSVTVTRLGRTSSPNYLGLILGLVLGLSVGGSALAVGAYLALKAHWARVAACTSGADGKDPAPSPAKATINIEIASLLSASAAGHSHSAAADAAPGPYSLAGRPPTPPGAGLQTQTPRTAAEAGPSTELRPPLVRADSRAQDGLAKLIRVASLQPGEV